MEISKAIKFVAIVLTVSVACMVVVTSAYMYSFLTRDRNNWACAAEDEVLLIDNSCAHVDQFKGWACKYEDQVMTFDNDCVAVDDIKTTE